MSETIRKTIERAALPETPDLEANEIIWEAWTTGRLVPADDIERLRAQRDKAVEALRDLGFEANCYVDAVHANIPTEGGRSLLAALSRARATLAEIEGARPTPPEDGEG